MAESVFHELIMDIRKRYTGKKVSIFDIRTIEDKYRICSIVNFRNGNCAFLRITSFGYKEVVFEDIVLDTDLIKPFVSIDDLIFKSQCALYELAYGVKLVQSDGSVIDCKIEDPGFDFDSLQDEVELLRKKCSELELKLEAATTRKDQISLFDTDD